MCNNNASTFLLFSVDAPSSYTPLIAHNFQIGSDQNAFVGALLYTRNLIGQDVGSFTPTNVLKAGKNFHCFCFYFVEFSV